MKTLHDIIHDIRCAVRSLRRSPGFAVTVIAMLAVGIGVNGAVYTVTHAVLFQGFPLVDSNDRVVYVTTSRSAVYYPDFEEWRDQAESFEEMALLRQRFVTFSDEADVPETYYATEVSADAFRLLGVEPVLGRDFLPSDEAPGAEAVVILRNELWANRYGMNPAILGRTVRIDGRPTTVIGVMPRGFSFPTDQEFWMPLVPTAAALRRETYYARYAFGRLANGVTIENARIEMEEIGRRLSQEYPATNSDVLPLVRTFQEWFIGPNAVMLFKAMWGAVALVLLIICSNVAGLLIDRAMGKSQEISIRMALGADRWRTIRQFLVEGVMLSMIGGMVGWWIAKASVRVFTLTRLNTDVPHLDYTMDYRVLAYLTAIAIGSGLLVGLVAAKGLTRLGINSPLKNDGRGITGGRERRHISGSLVSAQTALAVVLLASAGVMIRSFVNVTNADVGVDIANVLSMSLYASPDRYLTAESRISFFEDIESTLQTLPGVVSVALGTAAPTDLVPRSEYELADNPVVGEQARPTVGRFVVSRGYFRTLGATVISGREFDVSDRFTTMPVAIVNERFARQNWPGESPLGERLRLFSIAGREPTPWLTVVGVVSNIVQNDRTRQQFEPLVYAPYQQMSQPNMFGFARTSVAPGSLAPAVSREIYAMDPYLPVLALWPLTERLDRAYAFERNMTGLFTASAVVALLLASVGLYATVSRSVGERTREIAIRIAMGATGLHVRELVFRQTLLPLGAGLGVGLVGSVGVNRLLQAQMVEVSPADPTALVIASAVLVLSAVTGCLIPIHRAVRVDPVIALRRQ